MSEKVQPMNDEETEDATKRWKVGDPVYAVWAGNGCYYEATVAEVKPNLITVTWGDQGDTYREVSPDQVIEASACAGHAETKAWSIEKIDECASIRESPVKGRCLFMNEDCEPGQVIFVEKPVLVALPSLAPKLWEALTKLHETQPLNLGTVTFYFAALVSLFNLDQDGIKIILDKFVPDKDEEPGEDVRRILEKLTEELKEHHSTPIDPHTLQRLVSAWRYNSFGHHKEDGLVLYNRISMCAHSCDPSCCWSYGDADAFVLRARINLSKNDELTISYLQDEDLLKGTSVRQLKLQNWRFTCACERCAQVVDLGRGFRCRKCRIGICYASCAGAGEACKLEPCHVCTATPPVEDQTTLIQLEEEYVYRVENLDKTDVPDVEQVYNAAVDMFDRHWILYVMDTILWEAYKERNLLDAMEHQRRRVEFHEHYYCRPTFILAWCHEELGDALLAQFPHRKWQLIQVFQRAHQMLTILCGQHHQYALSPYQKLWNVQQAAQAANGKNGNSGSENKDP